MVTEKQILSARLQAWESSYDRKMERKAKEQKAIANDRPLVDDSEAIYDHCDTNGVAGFYTGGVQ